MPFDGAGFPPRRDEPQRSARNDNAVTVIIIAVSASLLLMPITATALIDIIRYVRG
jgi:hypothetical protein